MPYIVILAAFSVWMVVLIRRSHLSWHSIIAGYSIGVFGADLLEVSFNLLFGLYKFVPKLVSDPVFDNEWGIIFTDTLIAPFALIIVLHYAKRNHPWRTSLPFAILFIILEYFLIKFGYLKYIHWHLVFSALIYIAVFRFVVFIAPYITSYSPPFPYPLRLLSFSHTAIMWVGAALALPLFKTYQFRPGVFSDIMADCRFTDLLSGDILSILCAVTIPWIPKRLKIPAFAIIACIGVSFALYAYFSGWLIYRYWNHFFTVLRYFVPIFLIMLYDRWELSFQAHRQR